MGISAVSDPKRVPFPAAIITAISGFIVDSLYAEVYEASLGVLKKASMSGVSVPEGTGGMCQLRLFFPG